ncbi:hypothetical protein EC991_003875 [Linnemannia zychae]|nr:hypothetical protein EC991_003875 [Linnemannia zychae]
MISFINPLHSSSSPPRTPHSHNNQSYYHSQHDQSLLHPDQKTSGRSTLSDNKPRFYSIFSELTTQQVDQRQRALQQFPCEERHSYNPHYQHNLVSSPTYSSPPSLCPSSAGSSPSSAYSSGSSTSSLSRATGARALNQEQSSNSNSKQQDHHYYRHYNRRQNQRHYAYQQQNEHYHDDWMFGISEDDSYNGGASMACAQPQDPLAIASSSSTAPSLNGSLRSSISRRDRPKVSNGSLSVATTLNSAKHRRPTVTFSPVVLHHPAAGQDFTAMLSSSHSSSPAASLASAPAKLLPSIAESSMGLNSSMAMATAKADSSTTIQQHQQQQPASTGRMTAKQSLMRIAQLSKDQDGWCSHKAGQYTQGYAEARSRGMKLDGRRARRL